MYCHAVYNPEQQIIHHLLGYWLDLFNLERAVIKHQEKVGVIKILERKKVEKVQLSYGLKNFFPFNFILSSSKPTIEYLLVFHFVGTDLKKNVVDVKVETNIPKKHYSRLNVGDEVAVKYIPNPNTGIVAIELDMNFDE